MSRAFMKLHSDRTSGFVKGRKSDTKKGEKASQSEDTRPLQQGEQRVLDQIGRRLKMIWIASGHKTVRDFAEAISRAGIPVHEDTIGAAVRGERGLRQHVLSQIRRATGFPIDWLLEGDAAADLLTAQQRQALEEAERQLEEEEAGLKPRRGPKRR